MMSRNNWVIGEINDLCSGDKVGLDYYIIKPLTSGGVVGADLAAHGRHSRPVHGMAQPPKTNPLPLRGLPLIRGPLYKRGGVLSEAETNPLNPPCQRDFLLKTGSQSTVRFSCKF